MQENVKTADKLGHNYGTPTYVWSSDNSACTATRVCSNDHDHVETETANTTSKVTRNKTCTLDELTAYTASFKNSAFATQNKAGVVTADKLGHDYAKATYSWNNDYSMCTAKLLCTHDNSHVGTVEIVNAEKTVTQQNTCTLDEISTYTATFENSAFAAQTKENVKTANKLGHNYGTPTYSWSSDNSTCTAIRVCTRDHNHKETETSSTTSKVTTNKTCTSDELTTYTATFKNTAFSKQTLENVKTADKLGHNYGTPIYSWNGDYTKCTATCFCERNSSHQLTETVAPQKIVTQQNTCTLDEISKYVATFESSVFSTQTKENVNTANKLGHDFDLETDLCTRCNAVYFTQGLEYELVTTSTESYYKVIGKGTATGTKLVIPSIHNNLPVKTIADNAFINCTQFIVAVVPDSVTSIGNSAFYNCSGLTSITIPNSVTSIGGGAFYDCSGLTSITIPDSVTSIGSSAFSGCSSLESITIPDSITSIGSYAFSGCDNLKYNEYDNAYYLGNDNNPYIVLVKAKNTSITSCTINDKTKFIHSSAFSGCSGLTKIDFNGTKEQWNAISKGSNWKYNTGLFTVYCTDGTISNSNA